MTKCKTKMETKLKRIEQVSYGDPQMEFKWLIQHFSKENLISCFHELDRKKAVGIDGKSKDEYEGNLEENIESLISRMKSLDYYPAPVREVMIPKGNGKSRPLGISIIEDKIVQSMFTKVLTAIYDPLFIDQSYGFRPRRNCHQAIKDIYQCLNQRQHAVVIDVDLSNYFGEIDHRKLIQILELKIKDKIFLRYIVRMLKAGILSDGELRKSDNGTPQGSIVSPVLANIFAHYAIDLWFKEVVSKHTRSRIHMVRYADDICICTDQTDAPRILNALEGRLKRFSLKINREKTKVINFSKSKSNKGVRQGVFNFLGFTFYIGRSRKGWAVVKLKTAKKTFANKILAFSNWCRAYRNRFRLADLWKTFTQIVRGHIQYYGVSFNSESVKAYIELCRKMFFKWMNRRSQKKSFEWRRFTLYEKLKPLPSPKVVHNLF